MNENSSLPESKRCIKCEIVKPMADFFFSATGEFNKMGSCKCCRREYRKTRQKNDSYYYPFNGKKVKKLGQEMFKELKSLHNIFLKNKSKLKYNQIRLRKFNKIRCINCLQVFEITEVYKNCLCKNCHNKKRMKSYRKNKAKEITRYMDRRNTDLLFRLKVNIRSRINAFIKNNPTLNRPSKIKEYLGCSKEELKVHLENQFKGGMSWDNYGEWHIDHIIPLSYAKTDEELYKLCHYTNLQPLWARDNISKGGINRD